jgi:hypothetical protein
MLSGRLRPCFVFGCRRRDMRDRGHFDCAGAVDSTLRLESAKALKPRLSELLRYYEKDEVLRRSATFELARRPCVRRIVTRRPPTPSSIVPSPLFPVSAVARQ